MSRPKSLPARGPRKPPPIAGKAAPAQPAVEAPAPPAPTTAQRIDLHRTTVYFDPETWEALRVKAFHERVTAAELIRDAVRESLRLRPFKIRRGVAAVIEPEPATGDEIG